MALGNGMLWYKQPERYFTLWRIYQTEFHAAHHIKGHPRCGKTHGHTYKLVVKVDIHGWVDFHDIEDVVEGVLKKYDHTDLGSMTCEDLLLILCREIEKEFQKKYKVRYRDLHMQLFETSDFGAEYRE